jgi:hypothetical protein
VPSASSTSAAGTTQSRGLVTGSATGFILPGRGTRRHPAEVRRTL